MIKKFISKILKVVFDIFFEPGEILPKIEFRSEIDHYKNEIDNIALDSVGILGSYNELKGLIEAYKYRSEREKADIIVEYFLRSPIFDKENRNNDIIIVPAPMHWSRYLIRGFNHMSLIWDLISKKTWIPCKKLLSTGFSWKQSLLSKQKRNENRKGSIFLSSKNEIPKEVILIDDVISTGSTANTCARVLKDAWVQKVYWIFLASNQDKSILKYPNS